MEAVNTVPADNKHSVIILIRKGRYHEKIYLTNGFVTLVGEVLFTKFKLDHFLVGRSWLQKLFRHFYRGTH